jgi:tRNA-modifying protein YgfZ
VAFDKGCYVGQELTARMKHRGTARKRILTVRAEKPLPPAGTTIIGDALEIGEIISVYGSEGFALIRLDRLEEAKGSLTADNLPATITRPAWLDA